MEIQCIVFLPFHTYRMKSSVVAFAYIEHIKTESNKFDLAVKSLYTPRLKAITLGEEGGVHELWFQPAQWLWKRCSNL